MKTIKDLIKPDDPAQSIGLGLQRRSEELSERQLQIIEDTWKALTGIYGGTLVRDFGEEMPEEWVLLLKGITPNQIKNGLNKIAKRVSDFPPNGAVFRQLCLPETISPDGKNSNAYLTFSNPKHPEHEHYAKPKQIEDKTVVSKKRQSGNNHLKNLKDLF